MSGHQLAQGIASLGRNGESMLVHMQPREVAGLQALAMQHGGSLTINPETGLPEAGFFGDILGAVAPIGLGMLLGPAGLGMSALGAGLATGFAGFALSGGDLGAGLSAGLGGYGGSGLAESLKSFSIPKIPETALLAAPVAEASTTTLADKLFPTDAILGKSGAQFGYGTSVATTPATSLLGANQVAGTGINLTGNPIGQSISGLSNTGVTGVTATPTIGQGAMNALKDPVGFFKSGNGIQNVLTLASPLMAIQPEMPKVPEDDSYQMKYEGPYTAQDRNPRTPTQEEMTQLAAAGSPEYNYFGASNPYPGYNKAPGYAQGGITSSGASNTYSAPDGTIAQNTLNENYGLGRLNNLAATASSENAKEYGFASGGEIPYMPGAPSYGIAPTDLSAVAAIPTTPGQKASSPSGLSSLLGNAITDPMGRTQGGMGGKGGQQGYMGMGGYQNANGGMGGKGGFNQTPAPKPPALTMQDYITAATRTYDPNASMAAAMDPSGVERAHFTNINPQPAVISATTQPSNTPFTLSDAIKLGPRAFFPGLQQRATQKAAGGGLADGGFVVPADVVSHLGNGSTDAGLAALQKRNGARAIRGAGDGMSDSIRTTIEGRHPARIANGEAYIPPEQVKRSGGAKNLYAMMDKVRKARTGTKKQGKQINPNRFMTA